MQKFHPILFSSLMVQAIMEDRKTMTRRVIKGMPSYHLYHPKLNDGVLYVEKSNAVRYTLHPKGKVGDVLWVREMFTIIDWWEDSKVVHVLYEDGKCGLCKLTESEWGKFDKWQEKSERKPSLYLFKSLCRIFLEITDIKVERLQDISEEDAIREGAKPSSDELSMENRCHNYNNPSNARWPLVHVVGFKTLWQSINGLESWEANPFVWVISFRKITKPENFK